MPLSNKNKMINVKVSKDTFDFIKTFADKYKCSVSSFCQDCITQAILTHDKAAHDPKQNGKSPDVYYKQLAWFINATYDQRRK